MVNQSKRSMAKADMVSALRSRGVRGRLTSMRKGELYDNNWFWYLEFQLYRQISLVDQRLDLSNDAWT